MYLVLRFEHFPRALWQQIRLDQWDLPAPESLGDQWVQSPHPVREFPGDQWVRWGPAEAGKADRAAGTVADKVTEDRVEADRALGSSHTRRAGALR